MAAEAERRSREDRKRREEADRRKQDETNRKKAKVLASTDEDEIDMSLPEAERRKLEEERER